jgi:hypothetical protein
MDDPKESLKNRNKRASRRQGSGRHVSGMWVSKTAALTDSRRKAGAKRFLGISTAGAGNTCKCLGHGAGRNVRNPFVGGCAVARVPSEQLRSSATTFPIGSANPKGKAPSNRVFDTFRLLG